jgi:hypothetical protein
MLCSKSWIQFFFYQTVNSDQCMRTAMNPFLNQLKADEDSMGISCKVMPQQILLTSQRSLYMQCLKTEKSAKYSGLPDLLTSM